MEFLKKNATGLLLCAAIAIPAWFFGTLLPVVGGPVFAILIGMVVSMLIKKRAPFSAGARFTSKYILQAAVVLLGFGMNLSQVLSQGKESLPIILATITTSLVTAFVLYKITKIPKNNAILIGVGSSICGGSAIAATAPVINADDEEIAQSISVIFLFNIIAAMLFPALGGALGLSNHGFSLFAGTAVNDTSSVTAAAASWDAIHNSNTLSAAAIVKMTRTLAIIPITVVLALWQARGSKEKGGANVDMKKIFPWFVLFFVLASVVTTVFQLPPVITSPLKNMSKFMIVMAMASIGFNTNIVRLVKTGGKPILTGFCCWTAISVVSLTVQKIIGTW